MGEQSSDFGQRIATSTGLKKVKLVNCRRTTITMSDRTYVVSCHDNMIRVLENDNSYAMIRLKSQQVAYKATILGSVVLEEKKRGDIDFHRHFVINWENEVSFPELEFKETPRALSRRYQAGQSIELGLEDLPEYQVLYDDGVEAVFTREDSRDFSFSFSTGFYGTFHKEPDDSFTLKFKGDRLKAEEEGYASQSKFIVSRSKYTGNLLLVLQEGATVSLIPPV
jgi:hypothetical protein